MLIRGLGLSAIAQLLRRDLAATWRRETVSEVFICFADHFEPDWRSAPRALQRERVQRWIRTFPVSVDGIEDSRGRCPQHTFFYPAEAYNAEHLEQLSRLCHAGFGDVEVHLHHDRDTSEGLRETLLSFCHHLTQRHGLLRQDSLGRLRYGFIHGNWTLDNSHPQGRWCGVDDEITVLRQTGCYADFTMPSAPSPTQTSTINRIYYAVDDPRQPKSHDRGQPARVNSSPPADALLMIQGPVMLDWRRRRHRLLPRLENGNLSGSQPPCPTRLQAWLRAEVTVEGRDDWRFIKLHTHGAQEANAAVLLGEPMRRLHAGLARWAASADRRFYYVTAWEMAQLVRQAECGFQRPDFSLLV